MHPDSTNQYRPLLEQDPPEFIDRVDTPWDRVPDLAEYNGAAYRSIIRDLKGIQRITVRMRHGESDSPASSKGILIMGDAGTGKTHLLMRAASNLAQTNHILFVRKPINEEAVAQHIWASIVNSLARKLGQERSQMDDLLAHVFCDVLIPEFEKDIREGKDAGGRQRWITKLREDPYNLFSMLGQGDLRQKNLNAVRRRTLTFLRLNYPDVDQSIAYALVTYCLVGDENRKRLLLTWLSGEEVSEDEAKQLGLPPSWVTVDDVSSEVSIQQQREEKALRAIRSIGVLSTHYQPLLLAFDQLEGLRDEENLTRCWGNVVREIFTMAPNYLIITCVFPSLWKSWFAQALDESARQRIGQRQIELEKFGPQHAMALLKTHMQKHSEQHKLPDAIYPFSEEDVCRLCNQANSPREFLQHARQQFEDWLDGDVQDIPASVEKLPEPETAITVLKTALEQFIKEQRSSYPEEIPIEQAFLGRFKTLIHTILKHSDIRGSIGKATLNRKVLPPNFIIKVENNGKAICIAVMNGTGNSFAARFRNLLTIGENKDQFSNLIILRDPRCTPLGKTSQGLVEQLRHQGKSFDILDSSEVITLDALYDLLTAIEQHDLSSGSQAIDKNQYSEFFKTHQTCQQLPILQKLNTYVPLYDPSELVDSVSPAVSSSNFIEPSRIVVGDTQLDSPNLGVLGDLKDSGRRVSISLTKPQGIVILGYMGSGKSYALGVLMENALLHQPDLIRQSQPMSVLAFNYRKNPESRFEYGSFANPNSDADQVAHLRAHYDAEPAGVDTVNVFAYEPEISRRLQEYQGLTTFPIQFRSAELGAEHWEILMKPPTAQAEYMNIVRDLIQQLFYDEKLTLKNLERKIATDQRLSSAQRQRAANRLSFAQRWINDDRQYEWADLLNAGSLNVFDLRAQTMEAADALKLCLVITDLARRTNNGVNKMIVFDEAHEYVDCKELVGDLENALTQIRHDGLSFVLASQFPERIPERIFKYLLTRFIFKLPTVAAINYLRKAAPNLAVLAPQQVSNLDLEQGMGFIQTDDDCTDPAVKTPQLIAIRPRCSQHGGATIRNTR